MYRIQWVWNDMFQTIETTSRDKANREFLELSSEPGVEELQAFILTVDVKFSTNGKVYTYFCDKNLCGYRFIKQKDADGNFVIDQDGEVVVLYIVSCQYRTPEELRNMANSRGFSYEAYKTLHGIASK